MEHAPKLGCVLMAAGNARRFGENKLSAPLDGRSLILRALEAVPSEKFETVVVVTQYPEIMRLAGEFHFAAIHNDAPEEGISRTIALGLTALRDCDGEIDRMRDEYNMRRRLVVRSFNDMGLTCFEPRGAFYAFPCIKSTGLTSQEFCTRLLEEKHVAIIPGDAFGASGEGYCRVSYAYSVEHLTEALKRIREFLQENGLVQGN